ncbi:DUF6053 domain-containing protein [Lysobacter enzymogenes]
MGGTSVPTLLCQVAAI